MTAPSIRLKRRTIEDLNKTPAKTGIFSATLLLQKKFDEGEDRTHDVLAGKAISEVHFIPWSGDKMEFWQNL